MPITRSVISQNTESRPVRYAQKWPTNISGSDTSAPAVWMEYNNPHNNGLPIWGPGGQGVTVIRRIKVFQQTGYYAEDWWCQNNGSFDGSQGYWGFHPYPTTATNAGTSHWWEIATGGGDILDTRAGPETRKTVTKDVWYVQALLVNRIGASNKVFTFYTDLPSTADADIVEGSVTSTNYGEATTPNPAYICGDSPWYAGFQHERAGCEVSHRKIFSKLLSEADILTEAANLNIIATAEGAANIWYYFKGAPTVDDILIDLSMKGHHFSWKDSSNKATLGELL